MVVAPDAMSSFLHSYMILQVAVKDVERSKCFSSELRPRILG